MVSILRPSTITWPWLTSWRAAGIVEAVERWRTADYGSNPTPHLVLNLSAGWEPSYFGGDGPDMPVRVRAVKTALEYASCHGALIVAAAGNDGANNDTIDPDQVIVLNKLNPQIASRLLAPLTRWRKYDESRQGLMKTELERILASGELSSDVYEVVSKSLA